MNINSEFEEMGKQLLKHKYLYYIKAAPIITDYEYDMLERTYTRMAKALKHEPSIHLISDWDELDWLNNGAVVGFPHDHPWAQEIIDEYE